MSARAIQEGEDKIRLSPQRRRSCAHSLSLPLPLLFVAARLFDSFLQRNASLAAEQPEKSAKANSRRAHARPAHEPTISDVRSLSHSRAHTAASSERRRILEQDAYSCAALAASVSLLLPLLLRCCRRSLFLMLRSSLCCRSSLTPPPHPLFRCSPVREAQDRSRRARIPHEAAVSSGAKGQRRHRIASRNHLRHQIAHGRAP